MTQHEFEVEMAKALTRIDVARDLVGHARGNARYMKMQLADKFDAAAEILSELTAALRDHKAGY